MSWWELVEGETRQIQRACRTRRLALALMVILLVWLATLTVLVAGK